MTSTKRPAELRAAMAKATLTERVNSDIETATRMLRDATDLHASLALSLFESPDNKELQSRLESLENEIARHQRTITRSNAALTKARAADTEEAKARALRERAEKITTITAAARSRIARGANIDKLITSLGEELHAYADDGAAIASDVGDLLRSLPEDILGMHGERRIDYVSAMRALARGDSPAARSAIAQRLAEAGVGRVGIASDFVDIQRTGTTLTVQRATEAALDMLVERLSAFNEVKS